MAEDGYTWQTGPGGIQRVSTGPPQFGDRPQSLATRTRFGAAGRSAVRDFASQRLNATQFSSIGSSDGASGLGRLQGLQQAAGNRRVVGFGVGGGAAKVNRGLAQIAMSPRLSNAFSRMAAGPSSGGGNGGGGNGGGGNGGGGAARISAPTSNNMKHGYGSKW